MSGGRKCESCHGPGPCLHSDQHQRYLCVRCHEDPRDPFFTTPPAKYAWLRRGGYADYHSIIGRKITKPHCLIEGEPFLSSAGSWVIFIRWVVGYVSCAALTPPVVP